MEETWKTLVHSLGLEDPMEESMATHSYILAWRIPWTEEPGGLQPMGLQESDMTEVTDALNGANPVMHLYWRLHLVCPQCRGCVLLIRIKAKKLNVTLLYVFIRQMPFILLSKHSGSWNGISQWIILHLNVLWVYMHLVLRFVWLEEKKISWENRNLIVLWPWVSHLTSCNLI